MPSLISTSAVAVTALLGLMAARPTAAAQWELIAHVQDFCPSNPGDQWFNWSGSDSDCHSFADPKGGECLFTTVNDQGTFEGPACSSAKHPDTVTSINYLDGNDNGGAGCIFFQRPDCSGPVTQSVNDVDETDNCFELNFAAGSFQCP